MKKDPRQEEMMEQVQSLLEKKGRKALEIARKTVLEEEIECEEIRESLKYFMTEYWHDVARPALLSLACEAVGGDPELTIPIAIPMTLISGAIDIHDDIIDQSKTKGSRPTVLGKFGKDLALLVGDALLFKGFTLLHEAAEKGIPAEKISMILGIIKSLFFELGDAEALELRFRGRMDITPDQYLLVVKKKAADVEAHTRISAILGGGSKEEIESLGEYGRLLGMMIILRDDLIDIIDLEETIHRVKKENLPLPILYALQNSKHRSILNSILLKKEIKQRDAKTILEVTDRAGGLEYVRELMQKLAAATCHSTENFKYKQKELRLLSNAMLLMLGGDQNSTNPTI